MRRLSGSPPRRSLAAAALLLAVVATAARCETDKADRADAGCRSHTCHYDLHLGGTLDVGGRKLSVKHISDGAVRLASDGFSIDLKKGTDIELGGYHLRLDDAGGPGAHLSVGR